LPLCYLGIPTDNVKASFLYVFNQKMKMKNWHQKNVESYSVGDKVASGMGSCKFIIWQSIFAVL
jgi:hypothetical protein